MQSFCTVACSVPFLHLAVLGEHGLVLKPDDLKEQRLISNNNRPRPTGTVNLKHNRAFSKPQFFEHPN